MRWGRVGRRFLAVERVATRGNLQKGVGRDPTPELEVCIAPRVRRFLQTLPHTRSEGAAHRTRPRGARHAARRGACRSACRLRAEASSDVSDELLQVCAVDRWIAEAAACQVAVCVQAAAAGVHHRARAARRTQAGDALLPRPDRRMGGGRVERVAVDVQAGRGCAVEGDLDRVRLLYRPVGLDDGDVARREPE